MSQAVSQARRSLGWSDHLRRDLRGASALWRRDMVRFIRLREGLLAQLVLPLLYLLVLGAGLARIVQRGAVGGDYRLFLLPGVAVMSCLLASMLVAGYIAWDREFGFLKEVLVSPLSRTAVALGKGLGGATTASAQGMAILVLAPFVGASFSLVRTLAVVPMVVLFALGMNGFAIWLGVRIESLQRVTVMTHLLTSPLYFFSGVLVPLDAAPSWLRLAALVNPVSYAADAIRRTLIPGYASGLRWGEFTLPVLLELALLAGFALAMFALATRELDRQR